MPKHTPLELAFVAHLTTPGGAAFGNGTQAVIDAGYKVKDRAAATRMAYQLKFRDGISALIEKKLKEARDDLRTRAVRVVEETYLGATFDPKDLLDAQGYPLPLDKIPAHARRALTSVEIEVRERVVRADDGDRVIREPVVARYKTDKSADKERFLKWAGELKDPLAGVGESLEQLVLAADRKWREARASQGQAKK